MPRLNLQPTSPLKPATARLLRVAAACVLAQLACMNEFNYRERGASGSSGMDGHSEAGSSSASQSGAASNTGGRAQPGGAGGVSGGRAPQAGAESGGDAGGGGEGGDNGDGGHRAGRAGNGESGRNAGGTSGSGTQGGTGGGGVSGGGSAGIGASGGGNAGSGGAPMPEPGELTFGRSASASSEESYKGNVASKANDLNATTRWCASDGSLPQWWQVDLGSVRSLATMEVTWEFARRYGYVVEVSEDGTRFTTILDNTENTKTDLVQTEALACEGRYVRIRFTYLQPPSLGVTWACLVELRLFEP